MGNVLDAANILIVLDVPTIQGTFNVLDVSDQYFECSEYSIFKKIMWSASTHASGMNTHASGMNLVVGIFMQPDIDRPQMYSYRHMLSAHTTTICRQ